MPWRIFSSSKTFTSLNFTLRCLKLTGNLIPKIIYQISTLQSTLIIICFFTLVAGFIVSDFSLITVYQNSHTLKPLFYKIAGTWGNHEGSLLLWVIILTIFSFLFLILTKNHPKEFRVFTLVVQNILIEDKTYLHLKHSSHESGKFHIVLKISSEELNKYSKIDATKKIYKILDYEIKKYIHSIQILVN